MPYKEYKTSYLMKLTKSELIGLLRTAVHNYLAIEESLNNSVNAGKKIHKELEELKKNSLTKQEISEIIKGVIKNSNEWTNEGIAEIDTADEIEYQIDRALKKKRS